MTRFLITSLLAVTLACGKSTASPIVAAEYSLQQAADSIPLPFGREVHVGEVWMGLSAVPSDSRCPRDVVCVWAGDAVASIVVHPPCYKAGCKAASAVLDLHTTMEPRSGEGWGHRVQLLALQPVPVSTSQTEKSRYVAWVRLTR